jgi:hypothetical protein
MSSSKKKKEILKDYVPKPGTELVTIELEDDLYFLLLEVCIKERKALDQLINEILHEYIEKHKHLIKKGKKNAKKS